MQLICYAAFMNSKKTVTPRKATFTLGRDRFERISAVEGIKNSRKTAKLFAEFDRRNLTPAERRRVNFETFAKKS